MEPNQVTSETRTEQWRAFQVQHMQRQTKALESIRTFVAILFCLVMAGIVLFALIANANA